MLSIMQKQEHTECLFKNYKRKLSFTISMLIMLLWFTKSINCAPTPERQFNSSFTSIKVDNETSNQTCYYQYINGTRIPENNTIPQKHIRHCEENEKSDEKPLPGEPLDEEIGPIFDCERNEPLGLYAPSSTDCDLTVNNTDTLEHLKGEIFKFDPQTTKVTLYLCSKWAYVRECKGHASQQRFSQYKVYTIRSTKPQSITTEECASAINSGLKTWNGQSMGRIPSRDGRPTYQSFVKPLPSCPLLSYYPPIQARSFIKVQEYIAQITGDDPYLEQNVAPIKCLLKKDKKFLRNTNDFIEDTKFNPTTFCFDKSQKPRLAYVLFWKNSKKHSYSDFKSLGIHPILKFKDQYVVPSLSIGGSPVYDNPVKYSIDYDNTKTFSRYKLYGERYHDHVIQLDTGFLLAIDRTKAGKNYFHRIGQLKKYAEKSLQTTTLSVYQGHLSATVMSQEILLTYIRQQICELRTREERQLIWMIKNFPHTTSPWTQTANIKKIFTPMGDAAMVTKCTTTHHYRIILSRKIEDQCYEHFPIHVIQKDTKPKWKFLHLTERVLSSHGNPIPCSLRPPLTIIKLKSGFYTIFANGSRKEINTPQNTLYYLDFPPEIRTKFGSHLDRISKKKPLLPPFSAIEILTEAQTAISGLKHLTDSIGSRPTLIEQITDGVTSLIRTSASAGSDLIHAIADGTSEVIDSTGDAVKNVEDGAADILNSVFGGWPGVAMWIAIGLMAIGFTLLIWKCRPHARSLQNPQELTNLLPFQFRGEPTIASEDCIGIKRDNIKRRRQLHV